jgi:hypothetical protein
LDVSAFRLNRFNRVSMILAFYIHSWENAAWVSIFFRVQFPRKKCNNPKTIANMHLFQSKIEAYKKLANFHPRAKKNIYIHIYIYIYNSIYIPQHVFSNQPWLHGLLFRSKRSAISNRLHVGRLSGDWPKTFIAFHRFVQKSFPILHWNNPQPKTSPYNPWIILQFLRLGTFWLLERWGAQTQTHFLVGALSLLYQSTMNRTCCEFVDFFWML